MDFVGWAVNTDCKEVKQLKEGFSKCTFASIHADAW